MNNNLSARIWQEGKSFLNEGKVRKLSRVPAEQGDYEIRAHVDCDFGFVHHPVVRFNPNTKTVSRFYCDCWTFAEGTVLCPHCAALLASESDQNTIVITATPESNKRLAYRNAGDASASNNSRSESLENVTVVGDARLESGEREIRGRVKCDFGFVHYPVLVMDMDRIRDYHCDCYLAAESRSMCPHCQQLYTKAVVMSDRTFAGSSVSDDTCKEPVSELPEDLAIDFSGEEVEYASTPDHEIRQSSVQVAPEKEVPIPETPGASGEIPEDLMETPAPAPAAEPIQPKTMNVLLGYDRDSGEPVMWHPNDTEQLVHINTGIIGTMGTGKTQFTKSLVTQLCRQQANNFDGKELGILIFDYKGDYNQSKQDFVRATNARVFGLNNLPYNPFSLKGLTRKPQLPHHVASAFANILTKIYRLGPVQFNTLLHCIITAYQRRGITADPKTWNKDAPTFAQVYQVYCEENVKQDALYSAMYALAQFEIFEKDPSKTTSLFDLLKGVVVLDLSGYDSRLQNLAVAITLEMFCSQMLNSGSSKWSAKYRQLTKIVLVDEADNIMQEGFPALKTIMKEGREFGVGTILSTQSLKHFAIGEEDYAAYVLSWIVHSVPDLKKTDAEFIFKTSGGRSERLCQEIAATKKHESVAKIGNAIPVYLEDLPFWKISDDVNESYLIGTEKDPEQSEQDVQADI